MKNPKPFLYAWAMVLLLMTFGKNAWSQVTQPPFLVLNTEREGNRFTIFASNKEYAPVTVVLEYQLQNMQANEPESTLFVVPARTEKFALSQLEPINTQGKFSFQFKYKFTLGDMKNARHEPNTEYLLPFAAGKTFRVYQGYNGTLSHQNEKALDFTMPVGTAIHAARAGVVIQLVDKNDQGCGNESCKAYNNFINVLHDDGSIANYSHLQRNGVLCQLGQRVNAGEQIGWSGNTGWSTGPHLHFTVYLPQFGKGLSQDTYFKINGQKTLLKEGSSYAQ